MSLELQQRIFEGKMTRRELLNYTAAAEKKYRIQVFRNHSFELVEHTIGIYLDYAGFGVSFSYSGYDDSLSFMELDSSTDLVVIWIDVTRYPGGSESVAHFLNERIQQLRMQFQKPVLLIPFGADVFVSQTGVTILSLSQLQRELGEAFTDERAKAVTGTALSSKAMLAISKMLGLQYFPALLCPTLKAIVLDLDNTLYQGVLGEDGWDGIVLTEGHKQLQEQLKTLGDAGFLLCVASKNEFSDVEEMLEKREDFPLRKRDIAKICASWDSKALMMGEIAAFLNINPDSILFIDDNIGELTTVQMAYPALKIILANENGEVTARVLSQFPGMLKLTSSADDAKRKDDIQANETRQALQQQMSPEEYIRSLQIRLSFRFNDPEQIARISELANKTNQFIFNYKRYTQPEVEMRMNSKDYRVVTISLADRLSDSGLVGVCIGHHIEDYVEIEECFVSCRALGRGIDDVIVLGAIQKIMQYFGVSKVKVLSQEGSRNKPAQAFIKRWLRQFVEEPFKFEFSGFPEEICVEM